MIYAGPHAGDYAKITSTSSVSDNSSIELIPIGTICKVVEVDRKDNSCLVCPIIRYDEDESEFMSGSGVAWWYPESSLEFGKLTWIPKQ